MVTVRRAKRLNDYFVIHEYRGVVKYSLFNLLSYISYLFGMYNIFNKRDLCPKHTKRRLNSVH